MQPTPTQRSGSTDSDKAPKKRVGLAHVDELDVLRQIKGLAQGASEREIASKRERETATDETPTRDSKDSPKFPRAATPATSSTSENESPPRPHKKPWLSLIGKIIMLSVPLILIAYLGISFMHAKNYTATYSIDFDPTHFKDTSLPLYIDELQNSPKFPFFATDTDGQVSAQVEGSPISFVLQPKEYPLKKSITVSADIRDLGDWEISLVCPDCTPEKDGRGKYDWKPFYSGKIATYNKATVIDGVAIYTASSTRADGSTFETATTIPEWLAKNYPGNSSTTPSIQIYNNAFPIAQLTNPRIDYHPGEYTHITHTLRGPHEFLVYLGDGTLDLSLVKQDVNGYKGPDDADVTLEDMDGNVLVDEPLPDDGIIDANNQSGIVRKNIQKSNLIAGVYRLKILANESDDITNDWTITSIRINTNKIILANTSLILDPAVLYTEITEPATLGFYVWHNTALQTIHIKKTGSKKDFNLSLTDRLLSAWQDTPLSPGVYNIETQGDQYIRSDVQYLAFTPEQYFKPFTYKIEDKVDADIALATESPSVLAERIFTLGDFAPIPDVSQTTFQIRNTLLNEQFTKDNDLYKLGYSLLSQSGTYRLFGTKEIKTITPPVAKNLTFNDWINETLPLGESFAFDVSSTTLESFNLPKYLPFLKNDITPTDLTSAPNFVVSESSYPPMVSIRNLSCTIK